MSEYDAASTSGRSRRSPAEGPERSAEEDVDTSGVARANESTQFELPGMPAPLYPCTPTRLASWRDCPRRYRFSYLDRPQPPKGAPWAHNSVGAAVHSALADWFTLPVPARTPQRGEDLVRRRWLRDGFADDAQSARARERAAGWVRAYLGEVDPGMQPAGVERAVSVKTGSLVLSGRADRIDRRRQDGAGDVLVIVDYKTGRHVPGPDDARGSLALATYAVAAAATLHRACHRVELHHLPSATVAVADHSASDLAGLMREAETVAAQASAADADYRRGRSGDDVFAPAPGPGCSWCDFRRHCPAGRSAAPDRPPWSGLHETLIS